MSRSCRRFSLLIGFAVVVVAAVAVFAVPASPALAIPPCWPDCPPPKPPPPPPPPSNPPALALDLARQSTDLGSVRVAGWAADPDAPTTPLQVQINVDGVLVKTVTADSSRPDVGAAYPQYGAAHGYDIGVPAPATAQQVCVVAVNVGSGTDRTVCQQIDAVIEFAANNIVYDMAHYTLIKTNLQNLYNVSYSNGTTAEQSMTLNGSNAVTDKQSWTDQSTLKISIQGKVTVPIVNWESTLTLEGSHTWTQNGETTEQQSFTWTQPLKVPAKSQVVMNIAITRSTVVVPYTMPGNYVYASGFLAAGSINGTYSGINSYNFQITLTQYNLDGSPAAQPAQQAAPSISTN